MGIEHNGRAEGHAAALRRRCYLPRSVCEAEDVTEEAVFAGDSSAAMQNVALAIASVAKVGAPPK